MKFKILSFVLVLLMIFQSGIVPLYAAQEISLGNESQALLEEARKYRAEGNWDDAFKIYRKLLAREPDNAGLMKETADYYYEEGYLKEAVELYKKVVFLKPQDSETQLSLAVTLYDQGEKKESIDLLKGIVKANPDYIPARKTLANFLNWDQDWPGALEQYDAILKAEPDNLEIMKDRARVLNWSSKWAEAAQAYDEILEREPDNEEILKEKAQVLNWSGRWKAAIPLYEEIVRKNPDDLKSQKDLGLLYSWTQQWDKAQEVLEELVKKSPKDAEALEELGNVYYYDEKYDSARRIYATLAESNPDAARRLNPKISEISYFLAPTLSFYFLFYLERSNREGFQGTQESYYYTTEFMWPFSPVVKWFSTMTHRHDNITNSTSQIYTQGFQIRLMEDVYYRIDGSWEPRSFDVNPRWGLRNAITWQATNRLQATLYSQFTTYWDSNKSHDGGFGVSYAFFENRDVVFAYRLTHYYIESPNPYFVRLKDKEGRYTETLTNTFALEKYWSLTEKTVFTSGISYEVNTQGRSTILVYGSLSIRLLKNWHFVAGVSYAADTDDYEYLSASGFLSYHF